MSELIRPTLLPIFSFKNACQVYGLDPHELRDALKAGELKMELVTIQDYRLTAATIEAWLATRTTDKAVQ